MRRDAHQRADLRPDAVGDDAAGPAELARHASRRGRSARRRPRPAPAPPALRPVLRREVAARLRRREQRQLVDQAHRFVELDRERRDVGDARRLDPVEVARDRAAHGSSRGWLARARRSSLCFSAATSGSALPVIAACCTRDAQRRFDVDHQVLVARARHRLHQLLELAALQRHLGEARLEQRDLGGGLARAVLRLAGEQRASAAWLGAVLLALHQLALAAAHALVGAPGERRARRREHERRAAATIARPLQRRAAAAARGVGGGDGRGGDGRGARRRARDRRSRLHRLYAGDHRIEAGRASRTSPKPACAPARAMRGWVASARDCRRAIETPSSASRWSIASRAAEQPDVPRRRGDGGVERWRRSSAESRGARRR